MIFDFEITFHSTVHKCCIHLCGRLNLSIFRKNSCILQILGLFCRIFTNMKIV